MIMLTMDKGTPMQVYIHDSQVVEAPVKDEVLGAEHKAKRNIQIGELTVTIFDDVPF